MSKNKQCQHPVCDKPGIECVTLRVDDIEWYCSDHAEEHGFCYCCGLYCAGLDRFHFGRYRGLCDNCADRERANYAWEEEIDYEH